MKANFLIAAIALIAIPFNNIYAQDGATLFRTNCGACHSVGKGKLVGPDLKGVTDRHKEEWIMKWVKGSQTLVKAGDPEAVKVFNENSMIPMPDQALKDDEIKSIIAYVKTGGEPATVSATPASSTVTDGKDNITIATQKVADEEKAGSSLLATFGFTNYIVMFLIGILLLVIWVLSMSIKSLSEELKAKINN
jgi:cytochrome c2